MLKKDQNTYQLQVQSGMHFNVLTDNPPNPLITFLASFETKNAVPQNSSPTSFPLMHGPARDAAYQTYGLILRY
jgi:hypothetical protein